LVLILHSGADLLHHVAEVHAGPESSLGLCFGRSSDECVTFGLPQYSGGGCQDRNHVSWVVIIDEQRRGNYDGRNRKQKQNEASEKGRLSETGMELGFISYSLSDPSLEATKLHAFWCFTSNALYMLSPYGLYLLS